MNKSKMIALAFAMALGAQALSAQDYDKGLAAAQNGDYATALQEWRPLAAQGDATAQYNLGFMYHDGIGVTQDTMPKL